MTREKIQRWEIYEYTAVKDIVPPRGAMVVVRDQSVQVGGKILVNILIGDGVSAIAELRGNAAVDINQINQNLSIIALVLNNHMNLNTAHNATNTPAANRIPLYDAGGRLKTSAPLSANDAVRKTDLDTVTAQIGTVTEGLVNNKLDKKPDGTNDLVGADGKINPSYISDAILGAMIYGGAFNSSGIISASAYAPELEGNNISSINTAKYPGFFFISNGSFSFAGNNFDSGDWAVCQGNHTPAWVKIDTSDAVTSINGKTGTVVLTKADVGLGNVDNTKDQDKPVSIAQQAAITTEASARVEADTALLEAIGKEATDRQDADTALQENINAEASARQTAITTEASARQQAITTEASTRDGADAELQGQIDGINEELDDLSGIYAPIESPSFTGTPETTTPDGTVLKQITNVEYVLGWIQKIQEEIDAVTPRPFVSLEGLYMRTLNGVQYVMRE
jgi:hypothetical protein